MLFWTLIKAFPRILAYEANRAVKEQSLTSIAAQPRAQTSDFSICPEWAELEGLRDSQPNSYFRSANSQEFYGLSSPTSWNFVGVEKYFH